MWGAAGPGRRRAPRCRARLGGVGAMLVAVPLLVAVEAPAAALPAECKQSRRAVTCSYQATGEHRFDVPDGVRIVHVVAIGGAGAITSFGGTGARAEADIVIPAAARVLYVAVGGSGPQGGANGGGGGGAGGGGASDVRTCSARDAACLLTGRPSDPRLIVAGGGGGGLFRPGGDAGADASGDGAAGGPDGGGGATSRSGGAGAAGLCQGDFCVLNGVAGSAGTGGAGSSAGGGGGGGFFGGGGGGFQGSGGGGSSHGPQGATTFTRAIGVAPGVTIAYTVPDVTAPQITVTAPADGRRYAVGAVVTADFSCEDEGDGTGLRSCEGSVAAGRPIDTSSPGTYAFTVTATDEAGNSASKSVSYTVAPPGAPPPTQGVAGAREAVTMSRLVTARRCVTRAQLASASGGLAVGFTLSRDARVTYAVVRRVGSPRWRSCPRTRGRTPGRYTRVGGGSRAVARGRHEIRLSPTGTARVIRAARRSAAGRVRLRLSNLSQARDLRPGTYRLVVTARTADGATTTPAAVKFWIVGA